MNTVFIAIPILLINLVLFIVLKWSLGIKKNKSKLRKGVILIFMILFFLNSSGTGYILHKRYSISINTTTTFSNKSIDDLTWINQSNFKHYSLSNYNTIPNEQLKKILSNLKNECNYNDTITCFSQKNKIGFNNLDIWTHKKGNEYPVFFVSFQN